MDPNIAALTSAAHRFGVPVLPVLHHPDREPCITWSLPKGELFVDGRVCTAKAAFLRYDVFGRNSHSETPIDRALAWYSVISAWVLANGKVTTFNRHLNDSANTKIAVLLKAAELGISLPHTVVTNARNSAIAHCSQPVIKPIAGGAYCVSLADVEDQTEWREGVAPAPVFVQEQLDYPEYRVFVVGRKTLVFRIASTHLDHRSDQSSDVTFVENGLDDSQLEASLLELADALGLSFCAFDLKTRQADQRLCMLEVNSGPMFAAFDAKADGALCKAMLDTLAGSI